MKHTPLPWDYERPYQEPHKYISGKNTELIACIKDNYENGQANAEFIVRACNSHDELVENLQYIDYAIGDDFDEGYCDDEILEIHVTGKAVKDIKQALAKAKEV